MIPPSEENARVTEPARNTIATWLCFGASPIHGAGGFARVAIPAGTRMIEYVGERITKAESVRRCEKNNSCLFALDELHDLDGNVDWNPARYLNHSCSPNSEACGDGGRIWIVATRDIGAGEEVTFNYGYDLEDYREHPCYCGSPVCVGYMIAEELFELVRRKHAPGTREGTQKLAD